MLIKTVILDFDGFFYELTMERILEAYKKIHDEVVATNDFFWGEKDNLDSFEKWYDFHWQNNLSRMGITGKSQIDQSVKIFSESIKSKGLEFFKEVWEFIALLELHEIKICILSNSPSSIIVPKLEKGNHLVKFAAIVGPDIVQSMKPCIKGVMHCLKETNCEPVNAIIMGDHDFDMQAGKDAGLTHRWGAEWGMSNKHNLIKSGASKTFQSWEELIVSFKSDFLE